MSEDDERRFFLRITPTVRRALAERLPPAVAFAADAFMDGPLRNDPHRVGKRLLPPLADRHAARRGSYRVIYRIDDKTMIVTVVDIDHRATIYRPHSSNAFGTPRR